MLLPPHYLRWLVQISALFIFLGGCTATTAGTVTEVTEGINCKWEDSKIWPAASIELYETGNHLLLLRTLNADNWTFERTDSDSLNYTASMNSILVAAETRFRMFLERGVPERANEYPVNPDHAEIAELAGIRLDITNNTSGLHHDIDESYQIYISFPTIDSDADTDTDQQSWIELQAATVYGVLHGLETIKQLFQFAWMENNATPLYLIRDTPLYIQDEPAYAYRGLMIDTARHYIPLELILTNLQIMAANKLNVLHWHMTDSQSWPYQSTLYPEVSQAGAYCPECVYNATQIQTVIEEAALVGIRVIVEIDLPGHSQGTCGGFLR
jgi:hypothetical protein